MEREKLHRLLRLGIEKGASDIHFQVGNLPLYRFNGNLVELRYKVLTGPDTEAIVKLLLENDPRGESMDWNEVDCAFELPGEGRFRVNISRQRRFFNIVLRVIPLQVKSFDELNLPGVLRDIAQLRRGYVLVTGATGMGKSTTLSAMINEVNQTGRRRSSRSRIRSSSCSPTTSASSRSARSAPTPPAFPDVAPCAALRQDPDVIMVGELRDHETVDTSLKAAETGHLVFSSIHTSDVASTINRIVSFFPTEEQPQVRNAPRRQPAGDRLAATARRTRSRTARVPAVESHADRPARIQRMHQATRQRHARDHRVPRPSGRAENGCRPSTSTCWTC